MGPKVGSPARGRTSKIENVSRSNVLLTLLALQQVHHEGTGDEDRRVGTHQNTDKQSEDEPFDGYATEKEDHEQYKQRGQRSVHCTAQRGVDSLVDHGDIRLPLMVLHVLPDPVEDHHGIVDGVTDHGKDSSNEGLVDLHGEWHHLVQDGIEP